MDPRVHFPEDGFEDRRSLAIDLYADLAHHDETAEVSPAVRAFLDLSWADMWICNGGFSGLWQGSAARIRRLPQAAERIGAPAFAALFEAANEALLESDELFDRYFAAGDLADELGRFVLEHREEFFTDGVPPAQRSG